MKKLLPLALALFCFSSVKAQTFIAGGKLEGSLSSNAHITKVLMDPDDGYQYVAGWFTDSLDIDPGPVTNMLYSASGKSSFIAKYDTTSLLGYVCISSNADSVIINDLTLVSPNIVVAGGVFNGGINADPFGDGIYLTAPAGGYSGFVVRYDANYTYFDAFGTFGYAMAGPGNSCVNSITNIGYNILFGGYFTGTVDLDMLGYETRTATDGEDAFIVQTDDFLGLNNCHVYQSTAGNERVTHVMEGVSDIRIGGTFTGNIRLDFPGTGTLLTPTGGSDLFYASYDLGYNYNDGFKLGNAGNERFVGIGENGVTAVAIEYQGTIDVNPNGTVVNLTSVSGSRDVAVVYYDEMEHLWSRNLGNSGANTGTLFYTHDGSAGNPSIYAGLTFSGTLDMDPGTPVLNEATTLNPINAVVIELNPENGNYVTHYRIEGSAIKGLIPHTLNNNKVSLYGEYTGTNVDVLPWDSTYTLTHTANTGLFVAYFERCNFSGENVQLMNPYPCNTEEADLIFNCTGGSYPMSYDWNGSLMQQVNQNVGTGTYDVFVTDFHGCHSDTVSFLLPSHDGYDFWAEAIPVNTTCTSELGSASVTVNDPMGAVTYLWSNGDTGPTTDSLAAGAYSVNVTDESGCYVTASFLISHSDGPVITVVDTVVPNCYGSSNGGIDITITGGVAPLNILWSNGSTSEDLSGITGGTYAVMVTDANGCVGQMCINVDYGNYMYVNPVSMVHPGCGANTGTIEVEALGGVGPYTYLWDAAAGSQTTATATGLGAGFYSVTVTDNNGCEVNKLLGLSNSSGPNVVWDDVEYPSCSVGPGGLYTSSFGTPPLSYLWNTGSTSDDLTNVYEGGDYVLVVTDGAGCKTTFSQYLYQSGPYEPTVCMVTVDSTNTKNVVIWDKTSSPGAVSYNIYREGFCGSDGFTIVGNMPQDSLSVFYDTVVNTDTRSWRYYVTAIDSCGVESEPSTINNTMHLTASYDAGLDAVHLVWDAYHGVEIGQYDIFRIDPVNPNLYTLIHSTDAFTLAWNDADDMSVYTSYDPEWYVEAPPVTPCYATRAFNQNASRSNHTRLGMGTVIDTTGTGEMPSIEDLVRLFPNPANDRLSIRINGSDVSYHAAIMNNMGQQVHSFDFNTSVNISTAALPQGVYYVVLSNSKKQSKTYKLVIAH